MHLWKSCGMLTYIDRMLLTSFLTKDESSKQVPNLFALRFYHRRLMARSIRGSAMAKGIGKRAYYAQVDMEQPKAYAYAMEVMAAGIVTPDSQEGISAFFEKRRPEFKQSAR